MFLDLNQFSYVLVAKVHFYDFCISFAAFFVHSACLLIFTFHIHNAIAPLFSLSFQLQFNHIFGIDTFYLQKWTYVYCICLLKKQLKSKTHISHCAFLSILNENKRKTIELFRIVFQKVSFLFYSYLLFELLFVVFDSL